MTDFQAKCRLQALFPERESQVKRQADKRKLSLYFPDLQQQQERFVFIAQYATLLK